VYAAKEFSKLAPPPLPVSPDWSPVKTYGGYWRSSSQGAESLKTNRAMVSRKVRRRHNHGDWSPWWLGCECFV
jgi:hypothetical protein